MPLRILLLFNILITALTTFGQSNLIATEQYFQGLPQARSTFQYDAQGREVASKHYSNTANNTWGLHTSLEKKYDDAGRLIFNSQFGWEYSDDSLYYYSEVQTIYNQAGKISNEIFTSIYNASHSDEQKQKTEKVYQYDESGCLTAIINRTYFDSGGIHESTEQYESDNQCRPLKRTYGNDVTIWTYEPDNSYVERRYLIYEEDSTLITQTSYVNNLKTEQIYQQQERTTYAYNANGKVTERNRYNWEESLWVLKEQMLTMYNEFDQRTKEETLVGPDVLSKPLLYKNTTTYEYNEFGKVKFMESDWIDYNGIYSQSAYTTITFRCDGQPVTWVSTDMKTNQDYAKIFYYYSTPATCEDLSASVSLFPNPTTRYLKINTIEQLPNATLKIYNTVGQLLSEIPDTKNMTPIEVDINHLIPGIYFLKVESSSGVFSERFVKQ